MNFTLQKQRRVLLAASMMGLLMPLTLAHAQSPASVSVTVQVPSALRSAPFDVQRTLKVPPSFSVAVYARIAGVRFVAVAPNGDVLASNPGQGKVYLVRPDGSGNAVVSDFATGLRNPQDIVFHTISGTTYLYIAESNQISRSVYVAGDTTTRAREVLIGNLPDSTFSELKGAYGHQLKNIALDSNNKLYLSIASASNADVSDTTSDPVRCAIYQYNADGSGKRLFARGLRNAEGLAILPGTTTLWVTVNNRDNLPYPFHNDWDGDGSDDYGKVIQSYVDNHPPEEFTSVKDGANYGWPFANPNPDTASGLNKPPFDFDYNNNRDWSVYPESTFTRVDKAIQAHSAPLGFSFLQGSTFASDYRNGAVLAYHGSWNRANPTGYKVAYFPWDSATQLPGVQMDLVSGWRDGSGTVWGKPVDVVPDKNGNLLISDDVSGTIYKLSSVAPTPTPTPAPGGGGTGLKGDYYSGKAFNTLVKTQTDPKVDFTWDNGSPKNLDGSTMSSVGPDNFSVRWTGQVQAIEAGQYTFQTTTDDGVRLWVGTTTGTPLIDKWIDQGATDWSGNFTLSAGQKVNIRLEYYENGGGAIAKLLWKRPGQSTSQIVPQGQLYPTQALVNRTTGGTASASSTPVAAEGPAQGFDGQTSTKWLGNMTSNGSWLAYQFANGASYPVNRYEVTSANDDYGRDPKAWQFQGSNDGTNWTTLDPRTNQSFSGRFVTNVYTLNNSTSYNRYRLLVTTNSGSTETQHNGIGIVQFSELKLFSP